MKQLYVLITVLSISVCCSRRKTTIDAVIAAYDTAAISSHQPKASPAPGKTASDQGIVGYVELEKYLVSEYGIPAGQIQFIDSSCAISISPTHEQMEKMIAQAQNEEEKEQFYTATDDFSYYQNEALRRLDTLRVKIVPAEKRYIRLKGINKIWMLDIRQEDVPAWNLIFFHVRKEPQIADMVEVSTGEEDTKIQQYFDLK